MKNGSRVFDADLHVMEPPDLWTRRMPARFQGRGPVGLARFPLDTSVVIDGEEIPRLAPASVGPLREKRERMAHRFPAGMARGWDGVSHLQAMDEEGIDVAVLFPTRGLFAIAWEALEPEFALAIARAYNDWLAEFCAADPSRLLGAAMIPPHDAHLAAEEARRAARDLGFRGVFMRPNAFKDRYWDHRHFDVLWGALEALDIPVCFHEGGAAAPFARQVGYDRFEVSRMGHCFSHPGEMMQACIALCMGGVLERFPRLRAAFLEANCGWVPWLLWRMDEHADFPGAVGEEPLPLAPSAYFRRQCFVCIDVGERPGVETVKALDAEGIGFSTDYPHFDSRFPHAVEELQAMLESEGVTPRQREKILWDNCARLYNVQGRDAWQGGLRRDDR